jgi:hypothetical protein
MPPKNLSLAFGNTSWSNPEGMREMNLTLLVGSCADPFTNIYDGVNKMLVASAFIPQRKFTLPQGMLAVPKVRNANRIYSLLFFPFLKIHCFSHSHYSVFIQYKINF